MINLIDIVKEYEVGQATSQVLKGVTLTIQDGEFVGVLGVSGSGKSTLMHIMGLLDKPTRGRILIDKRDVLGLSDDALSNLRNEYVGFVFQQFNLINKLTVLENVLLPVLYARHTPPFDPPRRAEELLLRFGILERKDYLPNRISGGEQQRVAIARALMMEPKLILADEPTGNLDSKTGSEILSLLERLNKDLSVTIVIVTHEKNVARRTKRQIFLRDGRVVKRYL